VLLSVGYYFFKMLTATYFCVDNGSYKTPDEERTVVLTDTHGIVRREQRFKWASYGTGFMSFSIKSCSGLL
jgi:hypothetical protein